MNLKSIVTKNKAIKDPEQWLYFDIFRLWWTKQPIHSNIIERLFSASNYLGICKIHVCVQ